MRRAASLVCSALLLGAAAARAELRWQETSVERRARAGDEVIEAVFHFRNAGARVATLRPIEASCGCTTATTAKAAYATGETGEVRVLFDLRERSGLQEKTLLVRTVEEPGTVTTLRLRVEIPEALAVAPRLLVWAVGEAAQAKTVAIRPETGTRVSLSAPQGDVDAFVFALGEPDAAGARVLSITPRSTAAWRTGRVDLTATDERGTRTTVSVHAVVR